MRILHCIHSLSGGGAERQLREMVLSANDSDLDMYIFCVDTAGMENENLLKKVEKITDKKRYPWRLIGEIDTVVSKIKPDLIHCWLPVPVIVPAMIAAKKNGVPVVASYRNKKTFRKLYDYIEYLAVKYLASSIVSNNPPEQSHPAFRRLYVKKFGQYIPNSVTVKKLAVIDSEVKNKNGMFTVLFVGRIFNHQKNWKNLLEAVNQLRRVEKLQLLICGTGKEEAELRAKIQSLGLESHVELLGYRDDVYTLMCKADVLVLPSWYEGMPNVVVEAMALGLPCIVSKIPAHTLLFGDNAGVTYIDPADPSTLSSAIEKFINGDIDTKQIADTAKIFTDQLTPKKLINRYQVLYENTIERYGKTRKGN